MDTNDTNKILYKELCFKLNGLFFQIHNKLGRFLKEKQYADELQNLLDKSGIDYRREYDLKEISNINRNKVDFLIDGKIVVEIKAKKFVTKDDYYQMLRYLRSSGLQLGLLVNFRNTYIKPKRIINLSNNS